MQWLHQGAQPTERVEKLLKASGAWATFKGTADATSEAPAARSAEAPAPVASEPVETESAETETEPVSAEA